MAVVAPSSSSPETLDPKPDQSYIEQNQIQTPDTPNPAASSVPPLASSSLPVVTATPDNPVPDSNPAIVTPPPPPAAPSFTPSFRPIVSAPQFSPVVNPNIQNPAFQVQNPNLQPPGVSIGGISGAVMVTVSALPVLPPVGYYSAPGHVPGVPPRPYWQGPPNGYMGIPTPASHGQGFMHPPGIPRYPRPYPPMVRPGFPPHPSVPVGVISPFSWSLIPGSGVPAIPQVMRPCVSIVAPTEKPQTTVYVGKIASTVENDFLLSLLRLCGPVKSWKRAQDPSDGTPRGFGFCEFQSAEGVLRALRLLTKFNIDGQELVLNVNQATRQYLERYVEKKRKSVKHKETEGDVFNGVSGASGIEKQGSAEADSSSKMDVGNSADKEKQDNPQEFGIITDEDRDSDRDALEKLKNMIEERLKTKPLPPPPTMADSALKSNNELPSKSRERESDVDIVRSGEDKTEEEISSDNTANTEHDKSDLALSVWSRKRDRSRETDREHDMKREKERELERHEREKERERVRREREHDLKIREAERRYKDRVKEWEAREREKDFQRQYEKEREKERENKRRREIMDQEDESDDEDTRSRRHRSSVFAENRRKMYREKEEDNEDRIMEEIEIAEAKKREAEDQKKKDESQAITAAVNNGNDPDRTLEDMMNIDGEDNAKKSVKISDSLADDSILRHGGADDSIMESISKAKHGNNISSRKLGFGLIGSGKRTSVPSVFHEEDDEDVDKEKRMRPLVPIDYSTEELLAVHANMSGTPSNLVAAAEFAKCLSGSNKKEEKAESERGRSRSRGNNERRRDRNDNDSKHTRNENTDRLHYKGHDRDDKLRITENKKLLDAKQLIDMIPKSKEELFSYEINWLVYDKHNLQDRMRPWISKKITEFLGEDEATFVDYIVSSTKDHVKAPDMLQLLQPILDEEAEMFVLKMWRMLIFEIKKVETGLSMKSKA